VREIDADDEFVDVDELVRRVGFLAQRWGQS